MTGPNGYTQQVTSQRQLLVLPGSYTVTAYPVVGSASRYFPGVATQTVQVASAAPSTVTVDYSTIILNSTQVLDATGTSTLTVSPDGSTITFASSSTVTSSLAIGNILVSAPTSAAPNGLLVKIVSFAMSNGTVTATVQPASLSAAIQQGSLVFSQAFGSSPASSQVKRSIRPLAHDKGIDSSFTAILGASALDTQGRRVFQFVTDKNGNVDLYIFDLTQQQAPKLVQNVPSVNTPTYDQVTGHLLGVEYNGSDLLSIDPATGAATTVYSFGSVYTTYDSAALDSAGRRAFFMGDPNVTAPESFYSVDLTKTQSATVIPNFPSVNHLRF